MFEWDHRKAAANAVKHGVTLDDAVTVFLDPNALDGSDGETIRLISARRASRRERAAYRTAD